MNKTLQFVWYYTKVIIIMYVSPIRLWYLHLYSFILNIPTLLQQFISYIFVCVCLPDHQRLTDLGAELKQHCVDNASPFVPKVGEPCCAMFPGEATTGCHSESFSMLVLGK